MRSQRIGHDWAINIFTFQVLDTVLKIEGKEKHNTGLTLEVITVEGQSQTHILISEIQCNKWNHEKHTKCTGGLDYFKNRSTLVGQERHPRNRIFTGSLSSGWTENGAGSIRCTSARSRNSASQDLPENLSLCSKRECSTAYLLCPASLSVWQ